MATTEVSFAGINQKKNTLRLATAIETTNKNFPPTRLIVIAAVSCPGKFADAAITESRKALEQSLCSVTL